MPDSFVIDEDEPRIIWANALQLYQPKDEAGPSTRRDIDPDGDTDDSISVHLPCEI